MNLKIEIYESIYKKGQRTSCPELIAFKSENEYPDWREFQIYLEMYRQKTWLENDFTGLFSPKFELKTHITVSDFIGFVENNADVDICYINPFPQIAYWSYNIWMQGEYSHPGLLEIAQMLLDVVKIEWKLCDVPRHDKKILSYSNFWVGSKRFWERYVGEILYPIGKFLFENPDHPVSKQVLAPTQHTEPTPYLPFIVERLFSTFLSMNPDFSRAAYPIAYDSLIQKYCINDFERLIVERMAAEIEYADDVKQFNTGLIQKMDMLTALWQQHFFDFYELRQYPYTGKTISQIGSTTKKSQI